MTNREIAEKFYQLADLLEIQGDANPFRVVGLRRAARAVESLAAPASELLAQGKLSSVPGIGKGSVEKIEELQDRGSLQETEKLLAEIPEGLLSFLHIPDVGPKTVQTLWKTLHINTLGQLEEAALSGRLRTIKGFQQKMEEKILRGIELVRQGASRLLLGKALPLAVELVATLEKTPGVTAITYAGSLRRMKETIGDLDILATAKDPEPLMTAFVQHPMTSSVLARGKTKSSIRTGSNLQVDLRIVPKESFGAALQYFTGSKEHNVALRQLARERGFKINEYGIFRGEEKIGGALEEEIYAALGLSWIPPELRENRGEIEAAQKNSLPQLVERGGLRGDCHSHTSASDGQASLETMAEAALAAGLQYLAITDHSQSLRVAHGLDAKRLRAQMEEIASLRPRFAARGLKILCGMEVDILPDGSLDMEEELLEALDFRIGSVHSRFHQSEKEMTERILRAMASLQIDCLGHPTGRLLHSREPYAVDFEKIFTAACEHQVALEINASYERLDLNDILARQAKEKGVLFFINSDAHHPDHFQNLLFGIGTARRAWIEKEQVVNALDGDDLQHWLAERRKKKKRSSS